MIRILRVSTTPPDQGRASSRDSSPVRPPASASRPFFRAGRVWRSHSSQNLREDGRSSSPGYSSRAYEITDDLNTLPDPRNSFDVSTGTNTPSREPGSARSEYSDELATLTTKLINSINHQTSLDDNLQRTRHELEAAREQIVKLDKSVKRHEELVASGVLVQRTQTEEVQQRLQNELGEERTLRVAAEKQRKGMEMELETLTSSLFEEANTMVADARRENANAERRSEQLKLQLRDSESLLASHQQQLRELKVLLEQLQHERDQAEAAATPRTPVVSSQEFLPQSPESARAPRQSSSFQPVTIDQPLRFTHLIRPVLRMDIPAYEEFILFLQSATRSSPPTAKANSGSISNAFSLMGTNQTAVSSIQSFSTTPTSPSANPASSSPVMPGSFNTTTSPQDNPNSPSLASNTVLEKTKFYKRVLNEDIDPTLRLDAAPGLSFFARRTVVSSIVSSTLVVEPWPPGSRFHSPVFPCALCGEQRRDDTYVRRHRFRTSDSEDSQRYPLCAFCLEKVRATCELLGFLKLLKNGQWRTDGGAEESRLVRMAWEDCTRLRERMFWARIGGGVIPVHKNEEGTSPIESSQSDAALSAITQAARSTVPPTGADNVAEAIEPGSIPAETEAPALPPRLKEIGAVSESQETFVDAPETPLAVEAADESAALQRSVIAPTELKFTDSSEDATTERAVAAALQ